MPLASLSDIIQRLSVYDPDAISVAQAQQIIHDAITPYDEVEQLALKDVLGRVLARDVISPINVPPHDNAAMDGYALRGSDLNTEQPTMLRVVATALAGGQPQYDGSVQSGTCVRIMTGAPMPPGCDTVVPQEVIQRITTDDGTDAVIIPQGVIRVGDNRRLCGEDLAIGKSALQRGRLLRPADLGLLASLGLAQVSVQRKLRVAFFSTGDELRSVGEPLDPGCVYDSNRYTLYGMLTRLGCDIVDMGLVPDDPAVLEAALRSACEWERVDVILTSGGVSAGDADYTRQIMARLGEVAFWKIDIRPGRPMAFGQIASNGHRAWLFGLPGNPVAVMVSFYFLVREALLRMMGAEAMPLPLLRVRSQSVIRKKPGRTEYQRGVLAPDEHGNQQVRLTGAQGSGILRSMAEANCMIVLGPEQGSINPGDIVDVVVFEGLV